MKRFHIVLLILPLFGGGCLGGPSQTQVADPSTPSQGIEKYEDCMREMRGDVFAERTCEPYLESAR